VWFESGPAHLGHQFSNDTAGRTPPAGVSNPDRAFGVNDDSSAVGSEDRQWKAPGRGEQGVGFPMVPWMIDPDHTGPMNLGQRRPFG
jgi:hypothetical protein